MSELAPGLTKELVVTITDEITAKHMGSGSVAVLATPFMIALMEGASHQIIVPYLGPGQTSVGIVVNVRHLAATPLGMQVRVTSEVVSVEGRRVTFKVEAYDSVDKIGEGTHERMIIDLARFEERLRQKADRR